MKKNQEVQPDSKALIDTYHDQKLQACMSIDTLTQIPNRTYRDETLAWMLQVGQFFRLKDVTIENSMILFDQLLATITIQETQCVVFTLLFMSIKLFQQYYMTVHQFIERSNMDLSSLSILKMQIKLMKALNDNVTPYLPSEYYFQKHKQRVSGHHLLKLLIKSDFKKYRLTQLMDGLHCWIKLGRHTPSKDLPKDKVQLIKSLDLYFIQTVSTVKTK